MTTAPDAHCCASLDLDERNRAALLGLICSTTSCARRDLLTARPHLSVIRGGEDQ